jgi:hypothetical protein
MRRGRTQGWIKRLEGDRLEIFVRCADFSDVPDTKIRASGPEASMLELVEWFEEKTGLRVNSPILPRRAPKPIPGQLGFIMDELPSHDDTVSPMAQGEAT